MPNLTSKIYKSDYELLNLLIARNMIVFNKVWAAKILSYENYYYLINGYNKIW